MNNQNRTAILTIGDEILLGQIHDTNSEWLASRFSEFGLEVVCKLSVGDQLDQMVAALEFAFKRADLVIVTGGLGPTKDDMTKQMLADWFESPLEMHPLALQHLEEKMRRRGRPMNDMVLTQALHPVKAEYLENKSGTAPGIWFSEKGKICVALPGVPYEMKQLVTDEVLPRLKQRLELDTLLHRFIRTVGVPETTLALLVKDVESNLPDGFKLAYLPSGGHVKLRLTARGKEPERLQAELAKQDELLFQCVKEHVYAREDVELDAVVSGLISEYKLTVLLHDHLTDGRLRFLLSQHNSVLDYVLSGSDENIPDRFVRISIRKEESESGEETQRINVEFRFSDGEISLSQLDLRPFPVQEVNRNMLSLRALELLRRGILEHHTKLQSE
ncbi:MAG TPA: molybdopterin-binding protein [Catalimonadaceae bacterium]|nr:molybdopterin-binding protein [Catalimonadaceae bacterium]